MSKILEFYSLEGLDNKGRKLSDIWLFRDSELEKSHDYIQWLFPLPEPSKAVPNAPILSLDELEAFRTDDVLAGRVLTSFEIMLSFYGLKLVLDPDHIEICKNDEFEEKSNNWLTPRNHNYLRLTRIMRSLVIMNMPTYAIALYYCLLDLAEEYPEAISEENLRYWEGVFDG